MIAAEGEANTKWNSVMAVRRAGRWGKSYPKVEHIPEKEIPIRDILFIFYKQTQTHGFA